MVITSASQADDDGSIPFTRSNPFPAAGQDARIPCPGHFRRRHHGDEEAKAILGDECAGAGPGERTWRFGLKARASDPAGHSIYVEAPNDLLRDDLLRLFAADAHAGRPTRVYLRGMLTVFNAPLNLAGRTGLKLKVASTPDIGIPFEER